MAEQSLVGSWIHLHERDSDGRRAFVQTALPLPPSRGRRRLNFRGDGSYLEAGPGEDDRTADQRGRFELDASKGQLTLLRSNARLNYRVEWGVDERYGRMLLLKSD